MNTGLSTELGDSWATVATKLNAMFTEVYGGTGSMLQLNGNAASQVQFGSGTGKFALTGNISRQVSTAGVGNGNDTTEDVLFTYSLPAGSLDQMGRGLLITAFGSLANNAHTKTVKLYFGGTVIAQFSGTQANLGWNAQLEVFKGSALNAQFGQGLTVVGGTHQGVTTVLSATEVEANAITIKVTGQTATSSASDVVANLLEIQALD